jgi:dienelactone hydrolase
MSRTILPARRAGVVLAALLAGAASGAGDDLRVLQPGPDGIAPGRQIEVWLKAEVHRHAARRSEAFEKMIKSESAARAWQDERRAFFLDQIGGLPGRTPLNARVVGTLQGRGYRIEKVIFESRPGFHVTANVYLPESPPPWPAVLIPCGHSHDGKAAGQYQRASILLARHGMAAMCYDPVGQGERYQILDRTRQRTHFDEAPHVPVPHPNVRFLCTIEHTLMGVGSILLGSNIAQIRIWDGMRAIDYLQSRPDIIADRIGCAGNSGGGTLTAYLMALDDRIAAAAPGCYLTTFSRLIETRGPQDAEQNIFGQIAFGLDQADYVILRATKPTLILAGTRDATFDFRGTWELFLDAKRFYSRLGRSDAVEINAPDAPHGFGVQQREATARWMHRWLIGGDRLIREIDGLPDTISDVELRALNAGDWTAEQLYCTPEGQVLLMPGERSVFAINAEQAAELRGAREPLWRQLSVAERRAVVRRTVGARPPEEVPLPVVENVGTFQRDDHALHKLVLTGDSGVRLPALAFVPANPAGPATLYLHGSSMAADAAPGGPIHELVRQGHTVLAAELRGIGETEPGQGRTEFGRGRFGPDNLEILTAYLLGRSFVGMRVEDIEAWMRFLQHDNPAGAPPTALHLVGIGEAAIPVLHAAVLQGDAFRSVRLRGMIRSWEDVVAAGENHNQTVNAVHGVLRHYDLPDLMAMAGANRLTISEWVDPSGQPAK